MFRAGPSGPEQRKLLRRSVSRLGSVLKGAHGLAMHRYTAGNRLSESKPILSRSLDNPQVRFRVWMALQAFPTGQVQGGRVPIPCDRPAVNLPRVSAVFQCLHNAGFGRSLADSKGVSPP
ncbi:helix-turn-helix domain-containing protein [Mycobacterium sp. 48b]|uniref:helix-turn-helix domain-containing protein n=1 Tax=Mycobacterium sp. 48b TaxID=3400426 RepID=UPI003AAC0C20